MTHKPPSRPPRRRLSRQVRHLPTARVIDRLLQLAERSAPPAAVHDAMLEALFSVIWRRSKDSVWTCAELRQWGMLDPSATLTTGRALGVLERAGGLLGPWMLQGHRADKQGRLWQIRRRW